MQGRAPALRLIFGLLLLLSIGLRGVVPEGMMPDFGGGHVFGIRICDGGMPMTDGAMAGHDMGGMAMPGADHTAKGKAAHHDASPCPFALAHLLPVSFAILAAAILLLFTMVEFQVRAFTLARAAAGAAHRPRGPPVFSC